MGKAAFLKFDSAQNGKTLLFQILALPKTGKRYFFKFWPCPKQENATFSNFGLAQNRKTLLFQNLALPKTEKRYFFKFWPCPKQENATFSNFDLAQNGKGIFLKSSFPKMYFTLCNTSLFFSDLLQEPFCQVFPKCFEESERRLPKTPKLMKQQMH